MIRRTTLLAAAAAALVFAPTAAMAYEAPGFDSTVSDATPAVGSPITVNITGADPNSAVTLTITTNPPSIPNSAIMIAGTKSLTKTASASGSVAFTVTISSASTVSLTATDASGNVISTQTLTVGAAAGTGATGAQLSDTGFDAMPLALGAGALVLLGTGAVVVARRRHSTSTKVSV